jgi:hypothetical protein
MGTLTVFLQQEFRRRCPAGWSCRPERRLLPAALERLLGYAARADVLLERDDGSRRLWLEFEVSRADPVANHAKFATSHLFQPQQAADTFVALVSPHVTRGRRNLAANTIHLMRQLGMRAFQTVLLPHLGPGEVRRLNHLPLARLDGEGLPVEAEIERTLAITEPALTMTDYDLHLAGDLPDVFLNVRRWNEDLGAEEGQRLWGRRTVTYFVYEAETGLFAPSKFCAYTAVPTRPLMATPGQGLRSLASMTMARYAAISDGTHLLDGNRAQTHLTSRLGMRRVASGESAAVDRQFAAWLGRHKEEITVHPGGPVFLLAPEWFK